MQAMQRARTQGVGADADLTQSDSSRTISCAGFLPIGVGSVLRRPTGQFGIGVNSHDFCAGFWTQARAVWACPCVSALLSLNPHSLNAVPLRQTNNTSTQVTRVEYQRLFNN